MNKEMYDEFLPTEERLSLYDSSTKDDSLNQMDPSHYLQESNKYIH